MTEDDYDVIRRTRPELLLPSWWRIAPHFRDHLLSLTVEELVAGRTYTLLTRKDWHTPEPGDPGIRVTTSLEEDKYGMFPFKEV